MASKETEAYRAGFTACRYGDTKTLCPYGFNQMVLRSWWLAGWHDCDMSGE